MDTRDVLVVDVFTAEPMAGTPVGVVLDADDLAGDQRAAIADELGVAGTGFLETAGESVSLDIVGEHQGHGIHVAIAAAATLQDRGLTTADAVSFETAAGELRLERREDVWRVALPDPELREVAVSEDEVASAIGVDVAALQDVGADLPLARGSLGRGYLLVPVNFLEHVSGADPSPAALADVLGTVGADGVFAFTFDTLSGSSSIHGRTFYPPGDGSEAKPTGEAAACCGAHVRRHGAFDHDRDLLWVEEGDFADRPARLLVDLSEGVTVGGRTTTVIEGTVTVPEPSDEDDIIEA